MSPRSTAWFWLAGLALAVGLVYVMRGVLLPFVAGMAIAYLLDPLADRLEQWGLSRAWATSLLTAVFFLLLFLLGLIVVPVLYGQIVGFLEHLPDYVREVRDSFLPLARALSERLPFVGEPSSVWQAASGLAQRSIGVLGNAAVRVWGGSLAFFNLISLLLITPVVSFYLLRDWDRIVAYIDALLPVQHAGVIREQARRIDEVLAGFVRGQAMLGLALGVIYATGLSLIGLEFGLVIGLATGLLSFVPYLGMVIGLLLALIVGTLQWGLDSVHLALVVAILLLGQVAESAFLQPRLLGSNVGLHPVWVIFGVLAGGMLFGFVGVLLAVPVTATVGVLVRFALERYRLSRIYLGGPGAG